MKLGELAQHIQGRLEGADPQAPVEGIAPITTAGPAEVTFLANPRYARHVGDSQAAAVIVPDNYAGPGQRLIRCEDSYFAFRQALVAIRGFRQHPIPEGIDDRAVVDPSATIAPTCRIAHNVTVSAGASVGAGTVLYPGVFLGPDALVGEDCILYPNVVVYDGCRLGDRVTLHAGCSIGHDGFGYATHHGRHEKIPQAGWVELHDDVELGACCTVDRATMGPTVIGEGTKFSNLVAIGHGTQLGKHCLAVAQVGLAGSVIAGDYCVFAGQSGAVPHVHIGSGVRLAGRSAITHDVESGQDLAGYPAIPLAEQRRVWVAMRDLPEMRKTLRQLQKQVRQLGQPDGGKPGNAS